MKKYYSSSPRQIDSQTLQMFCRHWKNNRHLLQKPFCIPYVINSWGNRYLTVFAAISCGDLDVILNKMITENWNSGMRRIVSMAWFDKINTYDSKE